MTESVTLELDPETLARAREAGIDLAAVLEFALRRELRPRPSEAERKRVTQQWYEENEEAVDAYNEYVEKHGLFSDGHRKSERRSLAGTVTAPPPTGSKACAAVRSAFP